MRHELLMAMGTSNAFGHFFRMVATPAAWNVFTCPPLERVPSGNIIADQLFSFIRFASFIISVIDCRGSLRSILAPPPCFRLYEMDGIPFVSSIFEMNLAWYFRR